MRTATLEEIIKGPELFGPLTTVPVVDLYCGVGGFSTGAEQAGHRVIIAVDSWPAALTWHAANHPDCDHYGYQLPDGRLLARLPAPRTRWHLHGSPPCTLLSRVVMTEQRQSRYDEGLRNIRDYLEIALQAEPASFSMEQVATKKVVRLLDEYKARHPGWMDYRIVRMHEYGVPQTRRRIIAGSPWLIDRMGSKRNKTALVRAKDVCPTMPANAAGLCGQSHNKGGRWRQATPAFQTPIKKIPLTRRAKKGGLSVPAPTVLCTNRHTWADKDGRTIRCLTIKEHANLQTFPQSFHFPSQQRLAQRLCGNSVPPAFAKMLLSHYRLPIQRHRFPSAEPPTRPPSPSSVLSSRS